LITKNQNGSDTETRNDHRNLNLNNRKGTFLDLAIISEGSVSTWTSSKACHFDFNVFTLVRLFLKVGLGISRTVKTQVI